MYDTMRRGSALIVLTAALGLAACGSSGGGGGSVSQSQLESKLKKDPQVSQLTARLKGSQADIVLTCVAKALKKDADSGDLKDYVNGKKNLADIGGKAKGSAQKANTDAATCARNAGASG
jgi:hypothetical protein